ncbi:unnamed protein product, partial [Mesorhabditis spiculigera]
MTIAKIPKLGNLWLGDADAARDKDWLTEQGNFYRKLSVHGLRYEHFNAVDSESEYLIGIFDRTSAIIEAAATASEALLVHCEAGMSRSATLCCAALIKNHHFTAADALQYLEECKPDVKPNTGFTLQLKLYERMQNPATSQKDVEGMGSSMARIAGTALSTQRSFFCAKCRTALFEEADIYKHFERTRHYEEPDKICTGLIVRQLDWMECMDYAGKVHCPKCNEKLGHYCDEPRECGDCKATIHYSPSIAITPAKLRTKIPAI